LAGFRLAEISDFKDVTITTTSYARNVKPYSTHIRFKAPKSTNTAIRYVHLQPKKGRVFKLVTLELWNLKEITLRELKQVFENIIKEALG
jgi:hypothetical protein